MIDKHQNRLGILNSNILFIALGIGGISSTFLPLNATVSIIIGVYILTIWMVVNYERRKYPQFFNKPEAVFFLYLLFSYDFIIGSFLYFYSPKIVVNSYPILGLLDIVMKIICIGWYIEVFRTERKANKE